MNKELRLLKNKKRNEIHKLKSFVGVVEKVAIMKREDYYLDERIRINDHTGFLQHIWDMRREFIMKWIHYPSFLIISHEDSENYIMKPLYNSHNYFGTGPIERNCNGKEKHEAEVFGMKVIETRCIEQGKFFLA